MDMSLAMTGFAVFGAILFTMWYMLRSCKNAKGGDDDSDLRSSNLPSRGTYRAANLSPYNNNDDDNESVPQV